MGIGRLTIRNLLAEGKSRPFAGSVLQLGKQDIGFDPNQFRQWAQAVEYPLREPIVCNDRDVFSSLGFDDVQSMDVSGYEGATIIHDLNIPVPEKLHSRFDVVMDGGTCEHVFHFPQSLTNVHAMLKAGGRVLHAVPVCNYVDHGFYMFSPTVFWDYYEANKYQIHDCLVLAHNGDGGAVRVYQYAPGSLDSNDWSFGGFTADKFAGLKMFDLFFVARKLQESTAGVIPTQGRFRRMWKQGSPAAGAFTFLRTH